MKYVSPSVYIIYEAYRFPQRTKANRQAIESLAPRIEELTKLLSAPVPEHDINEGERRNRLGR